MSLPTSPLRLLPTAATFVGWDFHPLEFRAFSRRTELIRLDVSVSLTNNSSSEFETKPASDRKSARLGFDYLNKGQGAIIQVIHTGIKGSDVRIIGDIRGVKADKEEKCLLG